MTMTNKDKEKVFSLLDQCGFEPEEVDNSPITKATSPMLISKAVEFTDEQQEYIDAAVQTELRKRLGSSSGRKSTVNTPASLYLSKADQRSFEAAPLEHVIQKAMDVGGEFSELTDEERWFIGDMTMKLLFPDD